MTSLEQLWTLTLDGACRRVTGHLEAEGFPLIMLKGATIAHWLYDDPNERVYRDLDVLIDPAQRDAVIRSLGKIGYRPLLDDSMLRTSGSEESPLGNLDGVRIDLHITLKGVRVSPERAWTVLSQRTVEWSWAGSAVRVLDPVGRAMHLALHLAQRGMVDGKAARDLSLGLRKLDRATWRAAAALAGEIGALDAFTAGLELLPEGAETVAALRLGAPSSRETRMRASSASTSAVFLERAMTDPSWLQRVRVVRGRLFPSKEWLLLHLPDTARSPSALFRARLFRPFQVIGRLPGAYAERRTYRRERAGACR